MQNHHEERDAPCGAGSRSAHRRGDPFAAVGGVVCPFGVARECHEHIFSLPRRDASSRPRHLPQRIRECRSTPRCWRRAHCGAIVVLHLLLQSVRTTSGCAPYGRGLVVGAPTQEPRHGG
ncbi:hypothetical protein Pd630_LPD04785 [Rhodococcus opacus PD630]|nr:hypothetical protein Pd630_LPD04785 [Rhodococcus opacus PD630]